MTEAMKLKDTRSLEKNYDKLRQHIKKQRHHFASKGPVKAMIFPVVMYRCESWTINNAERQRIDALQTVVLEKILESPSDSQEIKPINPEGNQP